MGCGASNDVVNDNNNRVAADAARTPASTPSQRRHPQQITAPQTSTAAAMADAMNVLISCHTSQLNIAEKLQRILAGQQFPCYVLTESTPSSVAARANLVQWCSAFVVLVSRAYHHTPFCMETIDYGKDVRKPIVVLHTEPNFEPYGALGAIVASAVYSQELYKNPLSDEIVTQVSAALSAQKVRKSDKKNVVDPARLNDERSSANLVDGNQACTVLIGITNDGAHVGQIIYEHLREKGLNVAMESLTRADSPCSVRRCAVFVPVLTPEFEQIPVCRAAFEEARRLQKSIVPTIATKNWRPDGWIGLIIAASTFFRIFDQDNAYKQFFDSNRITDLTVEVQLGCQPRPGLAEREQREATVLRSEIEQCKANLQRWPPPRKARTNDSITDRQPVRVPIPEPSASLRFNHIHHEISRMNILAPAPVLDEYGLPKRSELDCMISYQWDHQKLVRKVYEDMNMRNIATWFDIWGSMQGNTNEAMATGVECAKVMLVFLSKAYVKSVNCLLEFRYAVKRGKAFVVVRVEPNIPTERWIDQALEGFPQYDVFSYEQITDLMNGVPTIDVITQAVRTLAQAQPRDVINDCSAELFELRSLLDDARDAIHADAGKARYSTCTRCNQQFDEFTKGGCKKHRAYYMGGTLMEGRWVCCRQQAKDAPGCDACDHIATARVFTKNPDYGTWTWEPA